MNALHSMVQGKVVGAGPECLKELGIPSCSMINVRPEIGNIIQKIEYVIDQRCNIGEFDQRLREYVETYHSAGKVAGLYLQAWQS